MKLHYYRDTDTLSIKLKNAISANTEEIAHDVVVDFDADGDVISIDIDLASKKFDLTTLELVDFPGIIMKLEDEKQGYLSPAFVLNVILRKIKPEHAMCANALTALGRLRQLTQKTKNG